MFLGRERKKDEESERQASGVESSSSQFAFMHIEYARARIMCKHLLKLPMVGTNYVEFQHNVGIALLKLISPID